MPQIVEATSIDDPQAECDNLALVPSMSKVVKLADTHHRGNNTEDAKTEELDSQNAVIVLPPANDPRTSESIPTPETDTKPSEHDIAVGIAEKMDPKYWPLSADMQATIMELKEPAELPDDDCRLPCSIPCKDNWCEPLGYTCDQRQCNTVFKGAKSVFQWWTDGLSPRWKLLYVFSKIFLYIVLSVMVTAKFSINTSQGESVAFDSISFVFSVLGVIISIVYAVTFCIRHREEVFDTIRETGIYVVLKFYKCCCCGKKFSCLEELKENEESNCEHKAAEKYVKRIEKFKLPQSGFQEFTAFISNTSEILLTIVDDVILSLVFILSLYSFMAKQDFIIFYGSMESDHVLGFVILLLSALELICMSHGLRMFSIAMNIRALDKKVERDSEDMQVKLSNKYIRYFLSFQARLVYHMLLSSVFQLYGIFALSWKIIQDSCIQVAPSAPAGNGINSSAPFICDISFVNGYTIYNILYIALGPTLLGYTTFFLCNIPWLVEYMRTVTMWAYLQIEYTTGYRVRGEDQDADRVKAAKVVETKTVEMMKMEGAFTMVETIQMVKKVGVKKVAEKTASVSPQMQLLKIFFNHLLCNVTDEELQEVGKTAKYIRQTIQEDYDEDAETYGSNPVSSAAIKLGQMTLCVPAALIATLQVVLFIIHIVFMGCDSDACFSTNIHAVLSSVVSGDVAAVLVPLVFLFLSTSFPAPWIGIFWILVVVGVLAVVAAVVAFAALVVVAVILVVAFACAGSATNEVTPTS